MVSLKKKFNCCPKLHNYYSHFIRIQLIQSKKKKEFIAETHYFHSII